MKIVILFLFLIFSHVQLGSNALPLRTRKDLESHVDKRETNYIYRVKRSSPRVEDCKEETIEEIVDKKKCKMVFGKLTICIKVPITIRKVILKCF